jgi:PAS domain S-box-containing protein
MRRRTQIVLSITLMVVCLVSYFSYVYISQILRQQIRTTQETARYLASQIVYLANSAAPDLASTRVNTNDPQAVRRAIAYYLSTDVDLNEMVESVTGSWVWVYDASIVDVNDQAILHSNPDMIGKHVSARPDFQLLRDARFQRQLSMVYNPPTVYEVRMPLELNGAPFGSVRLGISTVVVKNELTPRLRHAVAFSGTAIFLSLLLAAGLSHIAFAPLKQLSRTLDSATAGDAEVLADGEAGQDEYGLISLKIAHLGRQVRDAKEIFSALKDNVDQIMANLQDGLMLFTRDAQVVLVSASVEQFLGRPRSELLGRNVREIFSPDSSLASLVLDSFKNRRQVDQQELGVRDGKRVQVSLDFIQEHGTPIGALLTLRDTESARRIEDEIELSRRMSASGRLTRGVAHEVKNPINAIVLHLQLLRNKLQQTDADSGRHMDIIESEIHRLDRVVQILVDFTRPRDLHVEEMDLRILLDEVMLLAAPEAEQHGVAISRALGPEPLKVKVDNDAIKLAIFNVVLNGIQAMPKGGKLKISARRDEDNVVTEIEDHGGGISAEIQEKVFELYFSTKKDGSGIGLAQTYQVMQWHYGSVDFESADGQGTTFRLRLPVAEPPEEAGGGNGQSVARALGTRSS